jgi:hypothetical protein
MTRYDDPDCEGHRMTRILDQCFCFFSLFLPIQCVLHKLLELL